MKNNIGRIILIFYVIIFGFFLCPDTAQADMGPKPAITVVVENPPEGEYYLDLLIHEEASFDNLSDERSAYDQEKLALLESYNEDGWYAGLAHGTDIPMFGDLTGVKEGKTMVHHFSYMGVPDDYKIIIITPEQEIKVSQEIHRNTFQETVGYDYLTGQVSRTPIALSYLKQFAVTYLATLIIEGLILLLFGFSLKRNWKVFLIVNLMTQVLLTAALGTVLLKQGFFAAYLVYIPIEIVILVIEAIAFARLLKEHSKRRRVLYALSANLLSFVFGWAWIWFDIWTRMS